MANKVITSPKPTPLNPQPGMAFPTSPANFDPPPTLPGEEVSLKREAFNKKQFNDTVNTNFTQLGVFNKDPSTFDPSLATVGDLFTIYNTLFYQIPKEGETNSHLFLVKESTQYLQYIAQKEEIEELLDEINTLREQNLELVEDINTVTAQLTDALANQNN